MNNFNFDSHFDRPNNYKKICPYCGQIFFGRKNRDYCPPPSKCKQDFGNTKKTKETARIANEIKTYSKNEKFLFKHSTNEKITKVNYTYALKSGFDPMSIVKPIKDPSTGKEWFKIKIGSCLYYINEKENTIYIKRKK